MLNLVTPLIRKDNIPKIYASIPKWGDIHWIIVVAKSMGALYPYNIDDHRITIVELDIEEGWQNVHHKVNAGIEFMIPGFFQGLDDDTVFNEGTYKIYQQYKNSHKMIVGKQVIWFEDKFVTRCESQIPECGKTDGAQALIHTDILKNIKLTPLNESPCADGLFLKAAWEATPEHERILIPEVISKYNYLKR